MIALDLRADGLHALERLVLVHSRRTRQALTDAIRGEAFSLRQSLRHNLLHGAAAPGAPLRPLTIIARALQRRKGFGLRSPLPLRRLAAAVTYTVDPQAGVARVGFTTRSPAWARKTAARHQTGFSRPATKALREFFAAEGARRAASRSRRARRTASPLFLRKETTLLRTPARPIVDPFWRHAASSAAAAIRENFRRKLAGEVFASGVMERYTVSSLRQALEA